jgi:NosR/NirI family nitrous oxide reductase transcriptional regulator
MRLHLLTLLLAALLLATGLRAAAQPEDTILRMFPRATVIQEQSSMDGVTVWPVLQLNEVIGYAFETNDLVDFPGFSGERINLLLGLDTSGELVGVELLSHHEPIFMHGLGPQPFLDFLDQYRGLSLAERVIIGGSGTAGGTVYFDGVTKATVSVIVANDTILNAALKVARARLPAFAQREPARVKPDVFRALSWDEMVSESLVGHLHLGREQVEEALGSDLDDFPGDQLDLYEGGDAIDLYYAYLNTPTTGRNLLGPEQYELLMSRLKPGEQGFLLMSQGFYSYLPEDYRPATVPDRVNLVQNGLPVSIRDLNFADSGELSLRDDAPQFDNARIFTTRPGTGLDPSAPMQLQLIVDLAKNHLVRAEASFADDYALPQSLFDQVEVESGERRLPLWVQIWQARSWQIAALLTGLAVLTLGFAGQRRLRQHGTLLHRFRGVYLMYTLVFIGFYAQGQLSVVNIFTVQLALRDGFDLNVFLLDPIIFILWVYTFVSLFIVGRGLFCGWLCPFGALQEMVSRVAGKIGLRQWKIAHGPHRALQKLKYVILLALMGTALFSLGWAERGAEVEPFKTVITLGMIREWPFAIYAVLVLALGLFVHKFFCRYLCPLGAGLAILGRFRLFSTLERREECGSPCQLCRHRCEIDAIERSGAIDYNECVQCLECVVIMDDPEQCAPRRIAGRREAMSQRAANEPAPITAVPATVIPIAVDRGRPDSH